jgi:hypothetical protein
MGEEGFVLWSGVVSCSELCGSFIDGQMRPWVWFGNLRD